MESATGVDAGAPIGYKPMPLWDQVCVHLPARFGETPPSVSQVSIDALDGELMHELGHRRDRWLMTFLLFGGLALTVFVAGVGVLLAWNYTVPPQDEWLVLVGTVLCATGIAVAFVMHRCRVPLGRWFEHRADDYMLDKGGRERCDAALDWWAFVETASGGPGLSPVHDAVTARRARQARR